MIKTKLKVRHEEQHLIAPNIGALTRDHAPAARQGSAKPRPLSREDPNLTLEKTELMETRPAQGAAKICVAGEDLPESMNLLHLEAKQSAIRKPRPSTQSASSGWRALAPASAMRVSLYL